MDKKYTLFGALCIVVAIILGIQSMREQQKLDEYKAAHPELFKTAPAAASGSAKGAAPANGAPSTAAASPAAATPRAAVAAPTTPAAIVPLRNDEIEVTFTEDGGAIKTVALKNFPAKIHGTDPVLFNDGAPQPALALTVPAPVNATEPPGTYWSWTGKSAVAVAGNPGVPPQPLLARYTLDQATTTATSVTFRGTTPDGLDITRTYTLGSGNEEPFLIHHTTTIVNHGAKAVSLARIFVNAGMAPDAVTSESSSLTKNYLDFGYYDGSAANFNITVAEFMPTPAMFFGLKAAQPKLKNDVYAVRPSADLHWVSVKDQFFATVLMPKDIMGQGFYVRGVDTTVGDTTQSTISGDLELSLGTLAPGDTKKLELTYYVGPKKYVDLDRLGDRQDLIMQFGWFGGFSKILLVILIAIHKGIAPFFHDWAWGWTILAFTIILKTVTWPLTAIQVRSAKRMGQLSGPMKALREKYKDNPQKMQTEVLELYKKHKVNPAAGCLPMLITFPVFIAFNYMLRTASEMRYQPFLWIHDLAAPDTIAHFGAFSLNLLPLLMTATMMLQMRLTPTPTADNTQKTMMQFMPLIFLAGFYTMPSGMILYWTCNNVFTIFQQYLTNRRKDAPAEPARPLDLPKAKRR